MNKFHKNVYNFCNDLKSQSPHLISGDAPYFELAHLA